MRTIKNVAAGIFVIMLSINLCAQTDEIFKEPLIVEVDTLYDDISSYSNWYFSGQPNYEQILYLKELGLKKVINLRSESENEYFAEAAFCEKSLLESLGIEYFSIPISGRDGYSKVNYDLFVDALQGDDDKVLIHCKGAGRVTYFMMSYLIQEENRNLNDVKEFGSQLTYFSPLEALLGEK